MKGGRGVRRLKMEKTILNFHFDYLYPSPIYIMGLRVKQNNNVIVALGD